LEESYERNVVLNIMLRT